MDNGRGVWDAYTDIEQNEYCERKYLPFQFTPGVDGELVATLTSFVLIFYGAFGLLTSYRTSPVYHVRFSLLISSGIGSVLFHAFFWHGAALLDAFSNTLVLLAIASSLIDELPLSLSARTWLSSFTWAYALFTLSVRGTEPSSPDTSAAGQVDIFRILFVVPALIVLVILLWMLFCELRHNSAPTFLASQAAEARKLMFLAIVSFIAGCTAFTVDVVVCGMAPRVLRWTFPHSVWHFCIGYAALCANVLAAFYNADNNNKYAELRFVARILPCVEWYDLPLADLSDRAFSEAAHGLAWLVVVRTCIRNNPENREHHMRKLKKTRMLAPMAEIPMTEQRPDTDTDTDTSQIFWRDFVARVKSEHASEKCAPPALERFLMYSCQE